MGDNPDITLLPGYNYNISHSISGTDISDFAGPIHDPHWVVSVLSPVLFLVLGGKAILMCLKEELPIIQRFFIIHIFWLQLYPMIKHNIVAT